LVIDTSKMYLNPSIYLNLGSKTINSGHFSPKRANNLEDLTHKTLRNSISQKVSKSGSKVSKSASHTCSCIHILRSNICIHMRNVGNSVKSPFHTYIVYIHITT
jgi:hypothetical protein